MTEATLVSLCVPSRYSPKVRLASSPPRHLLPLLDAPDLVLKEVQWPQDYRFQLCANVFTQVERRRGMSGVTLRSQISAAWSHSVRETRGGSCLC